MKKIFLSVVLVCGVLALSATSVYALEPGCSPTIRKMQENHSDAMRAKDKAYAQEIIKRNDSVLALTCFDRSLMRTARLGQMFSDKVDADAPPPDTSVFEGELAFPDGGLENNLLAKNLNEVITPVLNEQLEDFEGSPTSALGSLTGNALNDLMGPLDAQLSEISKAQNSVSGKLASINKTIAQINDVIGDVLPAIPPLGVPSIVGMVNGLISSSKSEISALVGELSGAISPALADIASTIMNGGNGGGMPGGTLGGFSVDDPDSAVPQGDDCDRMEALWDDGDTENGAESIEGAGAEAGAPYLTMDEFLNGAAGAGEDFKNELRNATDVAAINAALQDLIKLETPGSIDSWPVTPSFPADADTDSIINGM